MSATTSWSGRAWMGLRWTPWMPLMAAHPLAMAQLPAGPGMYRVRRVDARDLLECIVWEGHDIREGVERLSRQVHLPIEPYDDPGSPAHRLWRLHRASVRFEVSGAPLRLEDDEGRAHALLLWQEYHDATAMQRSSPRLGRIAHGR